MIRFESFGEACTQNPQTLSADLDLEVAAASARSTVLSSQAQSKLVTSWNTHSKLRLAAMLFLLRSITEKLVGLLAMRILLSLCNVHNSRSNVDTDIR